MACGYGTPIREQCDGLKKGGQEGRAESRSAGACLRMSHSIWHKIKDQEKQKGKARQTAELKLCKLQQAATVWFIKYSR